MSPKLMKLAAKLLRLASDKFANHGCNDFELPADWSTEECSLFRAAIELWNDPHYDPADYEQTEFRTIKDYAAMAFLADEIEEMAGA